MARRRSRIRILGWLMTFFAVLAVAAVWLRPEGGSSSPEDSGGGLPAPLTGTRGLGGGEPALRPIVPPARETWLADDGPPTKPDFVSPKALVNPPAPPSTAPAMSAPAVVRDTAGARAELEAGLAARQRDDLLAARTHLNQALHAGLAADQAARSREALTELADRTIFSLGIVRGDPLVDHYVVKSGDTLGTIARRFKVSEDLLARVNGIADKDFIREGKLLKVVHGPFHALIVKSDHLMHVYLHDVYVRTFRVALGSDGSTPTGRWRVSNHQENPEWTDPRTGKRWLADDPQNPIGEYWIGIDGVEGNAVGQFGYGIHGTIEPESIGQNVSMGCVRLAPDDITTVYELLVPGESYVTINE